MLVLGLVLGEPVGAAVEHEPGRAARRAGEDRVLVGDPAVADPLLAPVEPVAGDGAVGRRTGVAVVLSAARSLPASGSVAP